MQTYIALLSWAQPRLSTVLSSTYFYYVLGLYVGRHITGAFQEEVEQEVDGLEILSTN